MLSVGFLLGGVGDSSNLRAASGVDPARMHGAIGKTYVRTSKDCKQFCAAGIGPSWYWEDTYLCFNGKLRPLGIPATADKLPQIGVIKILEAIYECVDFLDCSYGYRPGVGALDAIGELSVALRRGRYHYLVEADIRSFFDKIDRERLVELLALWIDDKAFLVAHSQMLKAGILEPDGTVNYLNGAHHKAGIFHPSSPTSIFIMPWMFGLRRPSRSTAKGRRTCVGTDDFVCAFELQADAERFYRVLARRLEKFGLEVAEEKTNLIRFSPVNWKASGASSSWASSFVGDAVAGASRRSSAERHARNTVPPWRASRIGVASTVDYRRRYSSQS